MQDSRSCFWFRHALLCALLTASTLAFGCQPPQVPPVEGRANFTSPQVEPIAVDALGARVYAANTTSNTVSVIDAWAQTEIAQIPVGLEPVSVELRPGGQELWVSNHVSDTVSVIDIVPWSPTFHTVVRTIQELDANGVSQFDEPVDIAFANGKAYVALSSRNDVAVIDPDSYEVMDRIHITAQEPRALAVHDGYLYVIPFESGNKSELSVCPGYAPDPPQCTMFEQEVGDFVTIPNLPGRDKRIVIDPDVPDRDLYVIDTATDTIVDMVETIGTLQYGVAVSGAGDVFVTHTDARNAENGDNDQLLIELENRVFENRIARLGCGGGACGAPVQIPLEPPLPAQPAPGTELATPYGVAISDDDSTLVVTAAHTSRLFTMDAATGDVLDILDLGPAGQQIPRGVALLSFVTGAPLTAYVLNTLENTVSLVDVSDPSNLQEIAKIPVGNDPTPEEERLGRIAFNNAFASDSGTFSCASCHPDGNTDQLLWRIGGACFFGDCNEADEPRSTMPVRGLTNTLPLHWDGTLGDPIGGRNGAVGPFGDIPANCTDDHSCFRQLVDASLSGVMCDQDPSCANGPTGLGGRLTEEERENMAVFLASVFYPPSRERALDDAPSPQALAGFSDFFVDHGGIGSIGNVNACGDMDSGCHSLPLLVSTNAPVLQGFDAPTLRGLNDRYLQFSMGMTMAEEAMVAATIGGPIPFGVFTLQAGPSPVPWDPDEGFEEDVTFATAFAAFTGIYNVGPVDIFQMIEELSTGFSSTVGRQVTLDAQTAIDADAQTLKAMLEQADERGLVDLHAHGRALQGFLGTPVHYSYDAGVYTPDEGAALTAQELLDEAAAGTLVATLTGLLPENVGQAGHGQPLLLPAVDGSGVVGNPAIPLLPQNNPMVLRAIGVRGDAAILIDGQPADGSIACVGGTFAPTCTGIFVGIELTSPPTVPGMHTVQVQDPKGQLSNDMPICVGTSADDCL